MDLQISSLLNKFTVTRLKDLIKSVRACKTAADERAIISRESANIRTSFKEDDNNETRNINVSKLLYIHMLGYPAHFGQIECLKLVASPRFSDKRLGYLGIMLLLDENQEILTLVTNSLKNDLSHTNMYIVGLALCTLGNISSVEMARDLSNEVEKLLGSTSTYIRKKSALCALRIIKKVPELTGNYIERAKRLLGEKHHGVLLTSVTLLTEICKNGEDFLKDISRCVPYLVKILRNLITTGYNPEHSVNDIADPFLQVKILRLLRLLGHNNPETSDAMNDILAQIVTNTDASKNTGNSVLYEAVLTIIHIESENSLRVLAINILGRFLANPDNNIKYVALITLTEVAATGFASTSTLQRHKNIILACLKDVDVSIRHRALDLSLSLINSQNVRSITRELLNYLEVTPASEKSSVASKICSCANQWKPNKRWEIDTICRILTIAGSYVQQDIINYFIELISISPNDLQQYITRKLYGVLLKDDAKLLSQEGLVLAGVWCIGEYGDILIGNDADRVLGGLLAEDNSEANTDETSEMEAKPSENEVIDLLVKLLEGAHTTVNIQEYILTALAKLTTRFSSSIKARCHSIISNYVADVDMEIQQRAVEYNEFMKLSEDVLSNVMERIPPLENATKFDSNKNISGRHGNKSKNFLEDNLIDTNNSNTMNALDLLNDSSLLSIGNSGSNQNDLLGLNTNPNTSSLGTTSATSNVMGLLGGLNLGGSAPLINANATPSSSSATISNNLNLLGGLYDMSSNNKPNTKTSPSSSNTGLNLLDDLFSSSTNNKSATAMGSNNASTSGSTNLLSMDLLGGSQSSSRPMMNSSTPPLAFKENSISPQSTSPVPTNYIAYNKNGLKIEFIPKQESPVITLVKAVFSSESNKFNQVNMQIAVPKVLRLQMNSPSGNSVTPGQNIVQLFKLANPNKAPIKLRLKTMYQMENGQIINEITEFNSFINF